MATPFGLAHASQRVLRHSTWDALLIALATLHATLLVLVPSIPLVAIGMWWNANTVAHNFIHRPFFRAPWGNRAFSLFLSGVLGVPQTLWRERHLRHHADGARLPRQWPALLADGAVVAAIWIGLGWLAPAFLLQVYWPGLLLGLGLCQLQGHFEHARGTTSYYGRLYNRLFFNDGLHVEHHRQPGRHWTELPAVVRPGTQTSAWPPVLRWIEPASLNQLERLALRVTWIRQFVLRTHTRALRALRPVLPPIRRIEVIGGGLFPRSALILRELLPDAAMTIIEARADHLALARPLLDANVETRCDVYPAGHDASADLLVVPLAFVGNRRAFYDDPPAPAVLVHDWIWRRRGTGVVVSWLLLKRLNLVTR